MRKPCDKSLSPSIVTTTDTIMLVLIRVIAPSVISKSIARMRFFDDPEIGCGHCQNQHELSLLFGKTVGSLKWFTLSVYEEVHSNNRSCV